MTGGRKIMSRLFVIVGDDASGKDRCIEAISKLGKLHAEVCRKFSTRDERFGDYDNVVTKRIIDRYASTPNNIVYLNNANFNLDKCDIVYERKGNKYGLVCSEIWDGLKRGMFQVVSITSKDAIRKLKHVFGDLMVLIYIHSPESKTENNEVLDIYLQNHKYFNHVLIYEQKLEDLYDQFFRLFRFYEKQHAF